MKKRNFLALAACLAAWTTIPATATRAADYPERPVRVIVPYGAGGSTDIVVRTIVNKVNDLGVLSQPLAVVNVTGAGGPVGFFRAKDADPDGYEILATHLGLLTSKAVGTTPFGAEAFEPIAQSGSTRFVFAVRDDAPYQSFDDFIADAKSRPGELPEANSIGGALHFASVVLSDAAGYKPRIVQVGGGAERIKSLLGGTTNHTLFTVAEYSGFKDSGVRALAYLAPESSDTVGDVPATGELGLGDGVSVDTWWFAPKGTPQDVIDTLADAIGKAMADPELQANLAAKGVDPTFASGADLVAHIQDLGAVAMSAADALKGN